MMTFNQISLIFILACILCVYAFSGAFVAAGPVAYTTIANTIDIMGAVEFPQENNAGVYGGENISTTLPPVHIESKLPSIPGIQNIAARGGPSFSSITVSSGPSISISSNSGEPNTRIISYSAPGGVFISHGSAGSSYVVSTNYNRPPQLPVIHSFSSPVQGNRKEDGAATTGIYGYIGHPGYAAVAERNLGSARQLVDGISSAVSHAVNINLAGIGAG